MGFIPGWWYTYPSEKYDGVSNSWDDDIPNWMETCSKAPTSFLDLWCS